jgi:ribonuclease R
MQDRIGEEFAGTIASVVPFGVFVALDSVYVEGLVHVSELGEDYFQYDNVKHQMLGERSGQRYRLGDRLRVKLVRADLESGRIDFVLATPPATIEAPVRKMATMPFPRSVTKTVDKPAAKASSRTANKSSQKSKSSAGGKKHAAAKKRHF